MFINRSVVVNISLFLLTLQGTLCLRNVQLLVPDSVERGSRVEMKCVYDLEQEVLYTVKWYRGDREFCRYSPRDVPPLKIFRIPGIEVDREETDAQRLTIQAATRTANGRYTCEVSADAPSFQTAQVHALMYVVDLPKSGPEMQGLKQYYRPGMKLKVECVSHNSLPAANLSFFINSEPIRCTANIYSIYLKSNEQCALEERVPTTPVSLSEINEVVLYPIHRIAETSDCAGRTSGTTLATLFTVLCYMIHFIYDD